MWETICNYVIEGMLYVGVAGLIIVTFFTTYTMVSWEQEEKRKRKEEMLKYERPIKRD
jgi:hypothetical protein